MLDMLALSPSDRSANSLTGRPASQRKPGCLVCWLGHRRSISAHWHWHWAVSHFCNSVDGLTCTQVSEYFKKNARPPVLTVILICTGSTSVWARRYGLGIADVQAAVCCGHSTTPLKSEFVEVSFKLSVSSFWTFFLIRKRKQLLSAQKCLSDWPKYVKWLLWFPSSPIHSIVCVRVLVTSGICPGLVTPTQAVIWESLQIFFIFI